MSPKPGTKDAHPPEKEQHTQNLNAALTDALKKWKAEEGPPNAILQFEASISPNPGGVSQYRCRLVPGPAPE